MITRTCNSCTACSRTQLSVESNRFWIPRHLVLEVTNQCNLDCIMCERRIVKPNNLMSPEIFESAMNRISPVFQAIELSGLGEPTLRKDFAMLASEVQNRGKVLYFPTNGADLKGEKLSVLRDSDKTRINFSVDAATAETYGKIRVDLQHKPSNFKSLIDTIESCRETKPNARLIMSFTAAAYNIDEFPDFVDLANTLGVNQVSFKPVRCWSLQPEQNSLRYQKDRTEYAITSAVERSGRVRVLIERPYYSDSFENFGNQPGFINYLDILPLDVIECGNGGSGTTGGTTMTTGTEIGTDALNAEIQEMGVLDSIDMRGKEVAFTDNVALITVDGIICSCAARHPIGDVFTMDFKSLLENDRYQNHLAARSEGRALESQWCRSCEKMM